jgi:hypothetical protein
MKQELRNEAYNSKNKKTAVLSLIEMLNLRASWIYKHVLKPRKADALRQFMKPRTVDEAKNSHEA